MHPQAQSLARSLLAVDELRPWARMFTEEAVSEALLRVDEMLRELASLFFETYPEKEEAPYALFIVMDHQRRRWDFVPKVGRENIAFQARAALATVMTGELGRV